ncbi:MAG TPA: carbohydrate-binding protein [Propionicimonas sp.]
MFAAGVLASVGLVAISAPAQAATAVHNWQTSLAGDRMSAKADLSFATSSATPTIEVDPSVQYQAIDGFGGAFNEAGWAVLNRTNVTATQRAAVLDALFNPTTGAGFSLTRTAMGSNDFALTHYSYDDIASGTDFPLTNFSVAHDEAYLIPFIQAAQSHGTFRIMASPWTAPGWMKTNGSLINGGSLIAPTTDSRYYQAYADYFARYVQAYAAHGITINDVSIQNEPLNPAKFEATTFTSAQMADFIGNYLGPKFTSDGVGARIRAYEHNRDTWTYPVDILNNAATLPYVAGINFHPYECDFGQTYCDEQNLDLFNEAKPGYSTWMSEHTDLAVPNASDYAGDERWASELVTEMQHGEGGYIYWNMVLDQTGGPFSALSDAQEPLVIVDTSGANAAVSYMPKYYHLEHFSKFVRPGAYRIGATGGANGDGLSYVAFKNADGSEVLEVVNASGSSRAITVAESGSAFSQTVAAHSTNTFTWGGTVNTYHVISGSTGTWGAVNGDHYTADAFYSGGTVPANTTPGIAGSADDPLYQSERYGTNFSYGFPVPSGRYRVNLKFSENYFTAAAKRVLNVAAEGTTKIAGLDIYAAAGAQFKALDRTFDVTVADGVLNLAFTSSVDNAKVDAIAITPLPVTGQQYESGVTAGVPSGYSTGTGTIPGIVFAQDYNTGGDGVGYHFAGVGGADTTYRADATHLEACTADTYCGDDLGWLSNGDTVNYTSVVNVSGNYDLHVRVASPASTGTFSIDLDGRPWIGTQSVPNTGGYQTWQSVNVNGVTLPLGRHTFTFKVGTGGFNLHYLDFSRVFAIGSSATTIESEWYAGGGEGFGAHDLTAGNSFASGYRGYSRGGDVDLEISSTGNLDVGNTENGEWLKYVVYNPTTKSFTASLKIATTFTTGQVRYDLDTIGNTIGSTTTVPSSGGWQTWGTVSTPMTIPSGAHAIYVYIVNGGFNIDSLTLS